MKIIFIVSLILFMSGCAGFGQVERVSDLSIQQLREMKQVKFIENPDGLNYVSRGKIKGLSCKGSGFSGNTTKESALTQIKIKAVRVNANAVLYPVCSHDASVDWGNNCWESWVCVGEAIRVKY